MGHTTVSVLLVTSLILKLLETGVTATDYCVIEKTSTDSICQTLQYYAEQSENISRQDDDITLTFLSGDHKLNELTFHLMNMKSFAFTTWSNKNDAKISVGFGAGITLENITNLTIQHVTIKPNPIEDTIIFRNIELFRLMQMNIIYTEVIVPLPTISPKMSNIRNTEITQSTFEHCVLIFGQEYDSSIKEISLAIRNASISSVRFDSIHSAVRITMDEGTYVLNFTNSYISSQNTGIHLKVQKSKLIFGMENVNITNSSEIGVYIEDVSDKQVSITMDEGTYLLNFTNSYISSQNTGIHLKVQKSKLIFDMENVNVTNSSEIGVYIEDVSDKQLSNIRVNAVSCSFKANKYGIVINSSISLHSTFIVTLKTCHFESNRKGIMISSSIQAFFNVNIELCQFIKNQNAVMFRNKEKKSVEELWILTITMKNCSITNNIDSGIIIHKSRSVKLNMTVEFCNFTGNTGVSMLIDAADVKVDEEGSKLRLHNCTFIKNEDILQGTLASVVQLHGYIETLLSNCFFEDNRDTPIEINFGDLVFAQNNWFIGNDGYYGGGVSLIYSSIIFTVNTRVYFIKNNAIFGGAIYIVKKPSASKYPLCFYSAADSSHVYLTENTAGSGGDAIYGAALNDTCTANSDSNTSVSVYHNHFEFNYTKPILSLVTSDPKRICLCDKDTLKPMCSDIEYIFHTSKKDGYPGEYVVFYIALVGYEFGTVSGTAYIRALDNKHGQSVAINSKSCTAVHYPINSGPNTTVTLVLTTRELALREYGDRDDMKAAIDTYNQSKVIPETLLTTPVYIDIRVRSCPKGFSLINNSICECDNVKDLECIICNSQRLFKVSGTQWIGIDSSSGVLYTEHAPHGHINESAQWVTLDGVANECPVINGESLEIDEQCVNNHDGNLCGKCKGNYSLTLGRPDCEQCGNQGLAFLLFFILAGPLLVALLKMLDLTVTNGSVNGLIIYANLVWANKSIIFNSREWEFNEYFLKVFIAWINLDFGITVCFFDGFNSVWKAFLQFLFPIYIWILAIAIIFASRYSDRVARVFGTKSVSLLATLFLLSYSKLLTAVTTVFDGTSLGSTTVWTEDGTIQYMTDWHHIVLFLVALAFSMLFLLPFTASLLLIQPLRVISHIRPFQWVHKLKPFFDAYTGILKDKYHYWVGFLILARGAVLITTAITQNKRNDLIALTIVSALLCIHTGVYKKWYLTLIEKSFLLNLNLLATALLAIYVQQGFDERTKTIGNTVTSISVGISFAQFVCIIIGHTFMQGRKLYQKYYIQPVEDPNNPPLLIEGRHNSQFAS